MSNAPLTIATMPKAKRKTYATWRLLFAHVTKKIYFQIVVQFWKIYCEKFLGPSLEASSIVSLSICY
jgi:hypothetical protein